MNNKYKISLKNSIFLGFLIAMISFSLTYCTEDDAYKDENGSMTILGIWVIMIVILIIIYSILCLVEHRTRRNSKSNSEKNIVQYDDSKSKKYSYVNPNLKNYPYFECRDCGASFEIDPTQAWPTIYVCCPKCNKNLLGLSDYGFGPVWPAQIYHGSDVILKITESRNLEITDKNNKIVKVNIPYYLLKNNYHNHMRICEYVFTNYIKNNR